VRGRVSPGGSCAIAPAFGLAAGLAVLTLVAFRCASANGIAQIAISTSR
jgi:hypothetical protein